MNHSRIDHVFSLTVLSLAVFSLLPARATLAASTTSHLPLDHFEGLTRQAPVSVGSLVALAVLLLVMGLVSGRRRRPGRR